MVDLNDLFYFAKVVEFGGFAPASRAITVPKSKLSRRVAGLEERLGVRLINRSSRQFSVTEVGQQYYEHCKAMLVEAESAQEAIDTVTAEPRGVIRLACPITLLHVHIGSFLADFMKQYPEITVHLEATNRRVDVISEGVDVAIRVRPVWRTVIWWCGCCLTGGWHWWPARSWWRSTACRAIRKSCPAGRVSGWERRARIFAGPCAGKMGVRFECFTSPVM